MKYIFDREYSLVSRVFIFGGNRSGSMRENSRMDNAKAAATFFVNTLLIPGNTSRRIAVVSFAKDVTINSGNVNNAFKGADQKQTLLDAIDGLSANGGTFTQARMRQAQKLLIASPATNKFIVLLSDGVPTFSYKISNPNNYLEPLGENGITNESVLPIYPKEDITGFFSPCHFLREESPCTVIIPYDYQTPGNHIMQRLLSGGYENKKAINK